MMSTLYKGQTLRRQSAIFPVLVIAAAVAIMVSLMGVAGVTGYLSGMATGNAGPAIKQGCKQCGVVESIHQGRINDGKAQPHTVWQTLVRLDDGEIRTFYHRSEPIWQIGGRVRIENDHLVPDSSR